MNTVANELASKRLDSEQLKQKVSECLERPKGYILSPHAIKRMRERNITLPQVLEAMVDGIHIAERDMIKCGNWRYHLEHVLDACTDDETRVIIPICFNNEQLIVCTAFYPREEGTDENREDQDSL